MAFWATLGSCLVQLVAPEAGGSGAAENKGTLERRGTWERGERGGFAVVGSRDIVS